MDQVIKSVDLIHFSGAYISESLTHVNYNNGERKEEEYFLFYRFFKNGIWICKTTDDRSFEMDEFLYELALEEILNDPHVNEPMLEDKTLVYQSGTYHFDDNFIHVEWRNTHVQEEPLRWLFKVVNENTLETALGDYELKFVE